MGLDASSLLDSAQIAGVQVQRLGSFKQGLSRSGGQGALPMAIWRIALRKKLAAERAQAETSDAPEFDTRAYLAVTADDLALISLRIGNPVRLGEVIMTVPRTEVVSAELRKSGTPAGSLPLVITLRDGRRWLFEVGRVTKGAGEKVVEALHGVLSA